MRAKTWTALVSAGLGLSAAATLVSSRLQGGETRADVLRRAETLYDMHCALCHGESGRADGPAAYLLFPPARDFSRARFKLASTRNEVPTNADLLATLKRGMPGSAMPSWSWMGEDDLLALAMYVREIAVDAIVEELRAASEEPVAEDVLLVRARTRMTPGPPIEVGSPAPRTEETLAAGERLYLRHCASCHGEDGEGRPDIVRRDEDLTFNWARDFTAGVLEGRTTHEELTRRIRSGLHGTAMGATALSLEETAALVAYVQSLIPPGAEDRLVQRRQTIRAVRVREPLPLDGSDATWEAAEEVRLALAPLWWREGAILHARVAALHDGRSLAVRIRWQDASPDAPAVREPPYAAPPYADAVALQLSFRENPPFFGMSPGLSATNIWHWRALDVSGGDGLQGILSLLPHRTGDWLTEELSGVPVYQIAGGPVEIEGETHSVRPAGMRTLDRQETMPVGVSSAALWEAGTWEVVLARRLEPGSRREMPLHPGVSVSIDFAIWNGAVRDLRGQKSTTIWHRLELAP